MTHQESNRRLANYLRIHRRAAGLSQAELGDAVGYTDADTVARHEWSNSMPPLEIAISYEVIFRAPVADLFSGLRDETKLRIEARLAQLEAKLGDRSARERNAVAIARKLIWLAERKNLDYRPRL